MAVAGVGFSLAFVCLSVCLSVFLTTYLQVSLPLTDPRDAAPRANCAVHRCRRSVW